MATFGLPRFPLPLVLILAGVPAGYALSLDGSVHGARDQYSHEKQPAPSGGLPALLQALHGLAAPSIRGLPAEIKEAPFSRSQVRERLWLTICLTGISLIGVAIFGVVMWKHFSARDSPYPAFIGEEGGASCEDEEGGQMEQTVSQPCTPRRPASQPLAGETGGVPQQAAVPAAGSDEEDARHYVTFERQELVEHIGVSGLTVFDPRSKASLSKMPMKWNLLFITCQGLCLQGGIIYFLSTRLHPRERDNSVPYTISFIAVYLHFIQCVSELPLSICLVRHMHDFHKNLGDLLIMLFILSMDAFVVPFVSFFVGSLYLCTSETIGDVILNACAVAFVNSIDNWILTMHLRTNFMAGKMKSRTVHVPISIHTMRRFNWWIVICPVVPVVTAGMVVYLAFVVMKL